MASPFLFLAGVFLLLLVNLAFVQPPSPPPYYRPEQAYYPPSMHPEQPPSLLLMRLSGLITSILFTLLFWMMITQPDPLQRPGAADQSGQVERDTAAPAHRPAAKMTP